MMAEEYKWSSAKSHVKKKTDPVLSEGCYIVEEIKDWASYLREKEELSLVANIRQNTKTGRPCGDDGFMQRI
jgi:hypothetical protein